MSDPIHAHALMQMIMEAAGTLSREELSAVAAERFGSDAVFTNCTGKSYSFEEIVSFLEERGKITCSEIGLQVNSDAVCSED